MVLPMLIGAGLSVAGGLAQASAGRKKEAAFGAALQAEQARQTALQGRRTSTTDAQAGLTSGLQNQRNVALQSALQGIQGSEGVGQQAAATNQQELQEALGFLQQQGPQSRATQIAQGRGTSGFLERAQGRQGEQTAASGALTDAATASRARRGEVSDRLQELGFAQADIQRQLGTLEGQSALDRKGIGLDALKSQLAFANAQQAASQVGGKQAAFGQLASSVGQGLFGMGAGQAGGGFSFFGGGGKPAAAS